MPTKSASAAQNVTAGQHSALAPATGKQAPASASAVSIETLPTHGGAQRMEGVNLGWPDRPLWPNVKAHWAKNKPARDSQRKEAFFVAKACGWGKPVFPVHAVHLTMTFCAPTARRFDLDNALAACKGAIDGLSACLGVDDSLFSYTLRRGDKAKGGAVLISAEIQ